MLSAQQVSGEDISPGPELSESELFEVLSNRRRRCAVHMLKHESGSLEIGSMAERIAAWENDVDQAEVTGTERKRVYTALQQSHLPKMDSVGVIEFRKDRGVVEPTPALDDVDVYLDVVRGKEIPWSEYYIGLSGVAAALVAALWVNAWPLVLFPDLAWAASIVVAFAFSAIAHRYYTTEMELGNSETPPEHSR